MLACGSCCTIGLVFSFADFALIFQTSVLFISQCQLLVPFEQSMPLPLSIAHVIGLPHVWRRELAGGSTSDASEDLFSTFGSLV